MNNEITIETTMSVTQYLREHQEMSENTHEELAELPNMFGLVPVSVSGRRPEPIIIEVSI